MEDTTKFVSIHLVGIENECQQFRKQCERRLWMTPKVIILHPINLFRTDVLVNLMKPRYFVLVLKIVLACLCFHNKS